MSKPRFRPSLAQTRRDNQTALDFYRALSPREDAPRIDLGAKAKRETRAGSSGEPLEAEVLRGLSQLLRRHPAVVLAIRMNSGAAVDSGGRPIWFHRLLRGRGVVTDFVGLLRVSVGVVPFALEAKRPGWIPGKAHGATRIREDAQAWFIEDCIAAGGRGAFVTSVDEAMALLDGESA